ncbi:TIGR02996 domain-containing protein [Gemmata sp. JC673]|uniref:TIGR02996 domain-containing protein n=1 Tax=Gemmata algarum TaxID=2975278 RepID=A0ABU5F4V3_9BACT|nr:TIGR02996 domain-containing protein [Gemmata algarum]MDY3561837.1 TIGR02996 domain-containing protein [Gemmata algarum]
MTETDRAAFLAAILDHPADDTHRLVYADALRESPRPFDREHGRFLWAGVTLAGYRGSEPATDGTFFDAVREQTESAPPVLAAQVKRLRGWDWPECAWDNDAAAPDRVTVTRVPEPVPGESPRERQTRRRRRTLGPAVIWERGCVTAVRLALREWITEGGAYLARCPIERAELTDTPGLVVRLRGDATDWRVELSLRLPAAADGSRPALTLARECSVGAIPADRRGSVFDEVLGGPFLTHLLADLRTDAGDRWPRG